MEFMIELTSIKRFRCQLRTWIQARWPLAKALSNQPINDSVTFKAGIVQYRLGKVVSLSAWRMNIISKWRY
jgi:hypothetical protein